MLFDKLLLQTLALISGEQLQQHLPDYLAEVIFLLSAFGML